MAEDNEHEVALPGDDQGVEETFGGSGDITSRCPQEDSEPAAKVPTPVEERDDLESGGGESNESIDVEDLIHLIEAHGGDGEREVINSEIEGLASEVLFWAIENLEYHQVKEILTAKALMDYRENALLLAIRVIENLHDRATKNEPEKADFIELANRVEEFTLRLLDPLKHDEKERESFSKKSETNIILNTAIKLEQKKFFDHPIIIGIMTEKWYGQFASSKKSLKSSWWLLLNIWCLFDIVLFPLSFSAAFVLGKYTKYKDYFTTPYFIFVRDTLSYLALLLLHYAICFEPSQLSFSGLEWVILVFLLGRLCTEIKQIVDVAKKRSEDGETTIWSYTRDRWNIFDIFILAIFFFAIFPMRIVTWATAESVTNNRVLEVAGYLYGLNTMLLTFRVLGSILETFEGVGTIQIAFFDIIRDAVVVVLHFIVILLAFSSTITKLFVAETSLIEGNNNGKDRWWRIATQLGWSLLDLSEGLDFFKSSDSFSQTLAQLLFAAYLVMAIILLINLLIALLSNTYQRVQDNSRKEWAFQKAITIQTYCNYHPIPVPYNIISVVAMALNGRLGKKQSSDKNKGESKLDVKELLDMYRVKYGNYFPDTDKLDQVFEDAEDTKSMVNQVLYRTFTHEQSSKKALLPTGRKAWCHDEAIVVEGCLLTCQPPSSKVCGATYLTPFSPRFPHFEVMILESGEKKWLGIGVMFGDEDRDRLNSGWKKGSVGYYIDWRAICVVGDYGVGGSPIPTEPSAIRRGDVVRCTVAFEDQQERDGKVQVPVVFSVNGSRIYHGNDKCVEHSPDKPLYVYPYIDFQGKTSVLAKMCPSEDVDFQGLQLQELKCDLQSKVVKMQSQLTEANRSLEEKLDAVLAKLP